MNTSLVTGRYPLFSSKHLRLFRMALLIALLIVSGGEISAQPELNFPDYLTLYDPSKASNPPASDLVAGAVLHYDKGYYFSGNLTFINTQRADNKVCVVTTASQVLALSARARSAFKPGTWTSLGSVDLHRLGRDSVGAGIAYIAEVPGAAKGYVSKMELLAIYRDSAAGRTTDIALGLIDRQQIPGSFAELGYDLEGPAAWASNGRYYTIAYTGFDPLRISDSIYILQRENAFVNGLTENPYSLYSAKGSPLVRRSGPPPFSTLLGILAADYPPNVSLNGGHRNRKTSLAFGYATLNTLASDIRCNCWTRDSALIARTGSYMSSVTRDNSAAVVPYSSNQLVTSAATAAAFPVTQYIQGATNFRTTYAKANHFEVKGYTMPYLFPGTSDIWEAVFTANEINVTDFLYDAGGEAELTFASVVIPTSSAAMRPARLTNTEHSLATTKATGFAVYPNPSASGIFTVSFPADSDDYDIAVYSVDGKRLLVHSGVSGSAHRMDLSALPHGALLLVIYASGTNKKVFATNIIY